MTHRMTIPCRLVLTTLAQADQPMYGYQITAASGVDSSTIYPHTAGRPPRRYHQLTPAGRDLIERSTRKASPR